MIIFQIVLSGNQIKTLVALRERQRVLPDGDPDWRVGGPLVPWPHYGGFTTPVHRLISEGLVIHYSNPLPKGKKHHYEVTKKGELLLEYIALDLKDFLNGVAMETRREIRHRVKQGKK